MEVIDTPDAAAAPPPALHERLDHLVLVDRATGKPYIVYVEAGKLMMEVI